MFFIKNQGRVYHVLTDTMNGAAPCGARMDRYSLAMLRRGARTPNVVEEMPDDARLCQHCRKFLEE